MWTEIDDQEYGQLVITSALIGYLLKLSIEDKFLTKKLDRELDKYCSQCECIACECYEYDVDWAYDSYKDRKLEDDEI